MRLHSIDGIPVPVTRAALVSALSLPETTTDDRLRVLVKQGRVQKVGRGLYAPTGWQQPAEGGRLKRHPVGVTRRMVLDAVRTLSEQGKEVTRHAIKSLTGLKMTTVDDRIKVLCYEEELTRLLWSGRYALAPRFPPMRPIRIGAIGGSFTMQVGDDQLKWDRDDKYRGDIVRRELPDGWIEYTLRQQRLRVTPREDVHIFGHLYCVPKSLLPDSDAWTSGGCPG